MDIFGRALLDFYKKGEGDILWLHNSYDIPEEMPIDIFFRTEEDMPSLEHFALSRCYGNVLDVGAGVGSHSLLLQELGYEVTAIDLSATAVAIMKARGVKNALVLDAYKVAKQYDTLLFLMNGIGFCGNLTRLADFFLKAKSMVKTGGQLLFDSSNIYYLYESLPMPSHKYFGEVSYCYEYKDQKGEWFNWLYIDQETLQKIAKQTDWDCKIIFEDQDHYLAQLKLTKS